MTTTIEARLDAAAAPDPRRPALLDADGSVRVTHGDLTRIRRGGRQRLRTVGVGSRDVVPLVMPSGWELATLLMAVAGAAVAVPLDPGLTDHELVLLLSRLRPRVVLADTSSAPRVRALLGADVAVHVWSPEELDGDDTGEPPGPDDPAILLFTSGTTAAPKIVQLTQRNLAAAADTVCATLRLGPADRALNAMTLHHGHGIFPGLLAPLAAGGSTVCCRLSTGEQLRALAETATPTWYSAAPVIHHSVLAMVRALPSIAETFRPRVIRSTSSALPVAVLAQLEEALSAPLVEAYALTEAPGQIASNPLDGPRKPGTVGVAQGTRIVLLTADGELGTEPGSVGEVLVQGPNVMPGYLGLPAAEQPLLDGWFRTGDHATIDADGYLTLSGRIADVISRGAEKFAPGEVEAVLSEHPAVQETVAFGRAHPTLGEEAAAAVILRPGATATEAELLTFTTDRLAAYKRPVAVYFVTGFPRGRTGKIVRRRLREMTARAAIGPGQRQAPMMPGPEHQ